VCVSASVSVSEWMGVMDRAVEAKHKRRKKEGYYKSSPAPVPSRSLGCAEEGIPCLRGSEGWMSMEQAVWYSPARPSSQVGQKIVG